MRNLVITLAVAFTSAVSFANDVNLKKVNAVLKKDIVAPVLDANTNGVVTQLELKIDEKSNLKEVKTLKTGIAFSATAKESVWSQKPTTIGLKLNGKTVRSDNVDSDFKMDATISSKTEAVPLYSHIASSLLEDAGQQAPENEDEEALLEILKEAATTATLSQIPEQLERLIVIIKKSTDDNGAWGEFINSLKVDRRIENFKTTQVVVKTTTEPALDFFGMKMILSGLELKMSDKDLSFGGAVTVTANTQEVEELLQSVKGFLSLLENPDSETKANLQEMAAGYITMVESIVTGN